MHYNRMSDDEIQLRIADTQRHIVWFESKKAWLTTAQKTMLRNDRVILNELKKELKKRFVQTQFDGF